MKNLLIILCGLVHLQLASQSFEFLDLPSSARIAALGGKAVSNADGDITMGFENPATLDSVKTGSFALLFNPYFADISRLSAAFQGNFSKMGPLVFGIIYTGYGDLQRRDLIGTDLGSFNARDYQVSVGKSHSVGPFSMGLNLKFASSVLDDFTSSALLFDVGGIFRHPGQEFYFGMVIKNVGWILSEYASSSSSLPTDVQMGVTFKPEYMPVRFTLTFYDIIDNNEPYSVEVGENIDNLDKIFRHLNLGGAFIMGKYLEVLVGYNQKRRQELRLIESPYGAGLSFGLLLKIREFHLRFSRSTFHAAGGTSFISLQSNVKSITKIF